jgi:DNA gyrase subunit B
MPELIERGYLYIAQPPLYKVERGKSAQYLKDQSELDDYLIEAGSKDARLELGSGAVISGEDLKRVSKEALQAQSLIDRLKHRAPDSVISQLAISGVLDPEERPEMLAGAAARLDRTADEGEDGWSAFYDEDGALVVEREVRGVMENYALRPGFRDSADARRLHRMSDNLRETFDGTAYFRQGDKDAVEINGPAQLLDTIFTIGRKGFKIQRYKGLGEMNPDQLWETTLDSNARSLLQVKIEGADSADDLFTKLMGDVVEPRRDFIISNALDAEVDT